MSLALNTFSQTIGQENCFSFSPGRPGHRLLAPQRVLRQRAKKFVDSAATLRHIYSSNA